MCWQTEAESRIREILDCRDVCLTSNATTALFALIKGDGIKRVILPVNICFSVPFAVRTGGAEVEFVDVNPENGLMDVCHLQNTVIDAKTALIVPHLYGKTANTFEEIITWAEENNVMVVEDIAQCFGGHFRSEYLGSFGAFAIASFGKGKNIDFGFGGALISNRSSLGKIRAELQSLPRLSGNSLEEKERLERTYTRGHYHNQSLVWFQQFYRRLQKTRTVFLNDISGFPLNGGVDFHGIEKRNSERHDLGAKIRGLLKQRFENIYVEEAPDTGVWWRVRLVIPDLTRHDLVLSTLIQKGIKVSKLYGAVTRLFNGDEQYPGHEKFYRESLFVDIIEENLDRLVRWN